MYVYGIGWIKMDAYFLIHLYTYVIQIYSGITSGRVLDGELLYTKILEVNLFAFAQTNSSRIFVQLYTYVYFIPSTLTFNVIAFVRNCFVRISPHSSEQMQLIQLFTLL